MSQIDLTFNGNTVSLIADDQGRYNLNQLYLASGTGQRNQSRYWLANQQTTDLIEEIKQRNSAINDLVKITRGRNGGTWVVKELVFAYAAWISPEFHRVVLETFSEAVEGNGAKAVIKAQSVARTDGVAIRKDAMSAVCRATAGHNGAYSSVTNEIYQGIFGGDAKTLRDHLKVKDLRGNMDDADLFAISAAESLFAALCLKSGAGDMSLNAAKLAARGAGEMINRASGGRFTVITQ